MTEKTKGIYPDELENAYSAYEWNRIVLDMEHRFNFDWVMDNYKVKRMELMMLIIERTNQEYEQDNRIEEK